MGFPLRSGRFCNASKRSRERNGAETNPKTGYARRQGPSGQATPGVEPDLQLGERDLAHARKANGLSSGLREVYDPAVSVRTPIIDAHHHGAARALVCNPHPRAKRQGLMCRRERVVVELFAVGRASSMKARAVARSDAVLERLGLSRATECKSAGPVANSGGGRRMGGLGPDFTLC